jgi:preprotein translocase subunit SecD
MPTHIALRFDMLRAIVALLLIFSSPALAERSFGIGTQSFTEGDIIDARSMPALGPSAAILITFADDAAARLSSLIAQNAGKAVPVELDGKLLVEPVAMAPLEGNALQIIGNDWTIEAATALAFRIAGKSPLPESLEE